MGFRSWIYTRLTWQTPEPAKKESIFDNVQSIEGQPNNYIWNGYYIELASPQSTLVNDGFGLWIYTISECLENDEKGERIGLWEIDNGSREGVLRIACNHIDLLILKEANLLGEKQ